MEIGDVLKKPFEDLGKLVVGSVLSLIPIVSFVLMGYGLEIAKKPKKLPGFSFEQWVLGLKAVLVAIVYFLVPIAVLSMGLSPLKFEFIAAGSLLFLLAAPVFTRAVLELGKKGNLSDGFKFGEMLSKAYSGPFISVWVVAALLVFGVSLVLSLIPVVGWFLSGYVPTVVFWAYIGSNYKF